MAITDVDICIPTDVHWHIGYKHSQLSERYSKCDPKSSFIYIYFADEDLAHTWAHKKM